MSKQQTIQRETVISGVGLHTGTQVDLKFIPAEENFGLKFQRMDLPDQPIMEANADLVTDVSRGTTLEQGEMKVSTVEHVLAAITGLRIDNLLMQVNGSEMPIMDGSSKEFVRTLREAGIAEQNEDRNYFHLDRTIRYVSEDGQTEIIAIPDDNYKISVMIDYNSKVLGQQHASFQNISEFEEEFASARTFCFLHELELLLDNNLIKGGDLSNAIVVVDKVVNEDELDRLATLFDQPKVEVKEEGILNNVELRHDNEPARHKLLDMVGDLTLIGMPLKAKIFATRPGHASNVAFAKKVKQVIRAQHNGVPYYDPNKEPIYDTNRIRETLPHRYPFLMIDKIIELSDTKVVGIKNVSINENFFIGHFPKDPVFPGVLQMEALAQAGGILALSQVEDPSNWSTYFLRMEDVRFKEKIVPGDTMILKMELVNPIRHGIVKMKGTVYVGNKTMSQGILTAKIFKNE